MTLTCTILTQLQPCETQSGYDFAASYPSLLRGLSGVPAPRTQLSCPFTEARRRFEQSLTSFATASQKCAGRELNPGYELGKLMSYH